MNHYELMVIIDPTLSENDREEVLQTLKKEVTSHKGKLAKEDVWWERKFAYKINKSEVGFYVLLELSLSAEGLTAVTNSINLSKNIWRHMFVRKDA